MNVRGAAVVTTLAAVAALGIAGCGDSGSDHTVGVTLTDYKVQPDATKADAGETTFAIANKAGQVHEFVVVKTDLAPDALPLDEDGLVDERGTGLEFVDEVEDLRAGKAATLEVDLTKGAYILLCNLPAHFKQGMYATFTVD